MVATNPNSTDKISEFSGEDTSISIKEDDNIISVEENGKNEIKVLPSCDTLADPIQLDSKHKSMIDMSSLGLEKVFPIDDNVTETINENEAKEEAEIEELKTDDKLSSLEDVVEKVVELYVAENLTNNTENVVEETVAPVDDSIEKKEPLEPDPPEVAPLDTDQASEDKEAELEEAISPSQSTSSRATRWEALADIAAELPPSLTVDPVTGHIYALSK